MRILCMRNQLSGLKIPDWAVDSKIESTDAPEMELKKKHYKCQLDLEFRYGPIL